MSATAGTNHRMNCQGAERDSTRRRTDSGREGLFSCVSSFVSLGAGSLSSDVAARSRGPQWSQSAAFRINWVDFNSGHSPAATSYQSTSSSLGQSARGGAVFETAVDNLFTSCRYFDTFLLQSAHERT